MLQNIIKISKKQINTQKKNKCCVENIKVPKRGTYFIQYSFDWNKSKLLELITRTDL